MEWPSKCYLKKKLYNQRRGNLKPVTLVPTEILNTSPRVLT